jgi:hypothetical protein
VTPDPDNDTNEGIWRIVGTPLVTVNATQDYLENFTGGFGLFLHSPFFLLKGIGKTDPQTGIGDFGAPGITDIGHPPVSTIVGYIQMRVERYSSVHLGTSATQVDNTFTPEQTGLAVGGHEDGHDWQIFADLSAQHPVYVADVVDPGGSPTGAPSSLRGLTLNPRAIGPGGNTTLPIDVVSVLADTKGSAELPTVGRGHLFGIHENADHLGRNVSQAYFYFEPLGLPVNNIPQDAYGRMTVFATQDPDRLDEVSGAYTQGEFQRDAAGRVQFVGHAPRLGPGIVMDGGLGLVQATAFRSTPRPMTTDTLGSLVIWGHNAAPPLSHHISDRSNVGVSLPSTWIAFQPDREYPGIDEPFRSDAADLSSEYRYDYPGGWG